MNVLLQSRSFNLSLAIFYNELYQSKMRLAGTLNKIALYCSRVMIGE